MWTHASRHMCKHASHDDTFQKKALVKWTSETNPTPTLHLLPLLISSMFPLPHPSTYCRIALHMQNSGDIRTYIQARAHTNTRARTHAHRHTHCDTPDFPAVNNTFTVLTKLSRPRGCLIRKGLIQDPHNENRTIFLFAQPVTGRG